MIEKILSKRIIIPAAIFFGGLLVASGVLMLVNFTDVKLSVASQSHQWTQNAGAGISVPACGSSSASVTCSGGAPLVSFSWTVDGPDPSGVTCASASITVSPGGIVATGKPCGGGLNWSGASNNTAYAYNINFENGGHLIASGSFTTPSCLPPPPGDFNLSLSGSVACNSVPLSWTASSGATAYRILRGSPRVDISPYQPYTAQNFTDSTVSQNTTYQYQIEAYNSGGTNRSNNINVSTPYCPPTMNFSGSTTSIFQGQSTTLTWSSANATSCVASGAWSGGKALSGSEIVFPSPPPSATYSLTCSGPGGSASGSVTVNITPLALPNWREIIPR